MNTNRRMTRSSSDRFIGGVCGGLAEYLGVDSTLVRIGFVLLALAGISPLIYVLLWVVMPLDTAAPSGSWAQQVQQSVGEMQERATTIAREVSTQVQNLTGTPNQTPPNQTPPNQTPPADDQGPSTGPTRRL